MPKITSSFITYRANSHASKLRHIKSLGQISLNSMQRPKMFKKSLTALQQSKIHRVINFVNIHRFPSKYLSFILKALQHSSKFLKKVLFKGTSPSSLYKHPPTFKRIFIKFAKLETLSLVSFEARYLKYCRSLRNLKLSIPEEPKTSSQVLSQIRNLRYLERVEVCISNANLALTTLKEVHRRIKSKHCWLDITLLKAFWPCVDNIEALSTPNFKKIASVQLDLAKLPATPNTIDHKKLELHLNFLRFLLEPTSKVHNKHKQFERIKFPGMKLKLDPKEYESTKKKRTLIKQLEDLKLELSGSSIGSFLENCLSVYASSVFYYLDRLDVVEYQPEQNLAKLYFELRSWASAWEVLELLKDIIEFKDIKYLYLELEMKEMTNDEFKKIIEEICKIERLQFLYVASGSFSLEVEHPYERKLEELIKLEKGKMISLKA